MTRVRRNPDSSDSVRARLAAIREIVRMPAADAIRFDETTLEAEEIRANTMHGGVTVRIDAMLGVARIPMQIDVGFGDVILPPAARAEFPVLLDHPPPEVAVYPRESVVAEKAEAILTLGATNSRMKDFYDLFVLSDAFAFAGSSLTASLEATFGHRGTGIPSELPLALTPDFMAEPGRAVQ